MGLPNRETTYKEGEHVSALKSRNALNNYFPGQVVKVHKRPSVEETHWNAEKSIVLHLILHTLSCFVFYNPKLLYDVKYPDAPPRTWELTESRPSILSDCKIQNLQQTAALPMDVKDMPIIVYRSSLKHTAEFKGFRWQTKNLRGSVIPAFCAIARLAMQSATDFHIKSLRMVTDPVTHPCVHRHVLVSQAYLSQRAALSQLDIDKRL